MYSLTQAMTTPPLQRRPSQGLKTDIASLYIHLSHTLSAIIPMYIKDDVPSMSHTRPVYNTIAAVNAIVHVRTSTIIGMLTSGQSRGNSRNVGNVKGVNVGCAVYTGLGGHTFPSQ